MKRIFFVIACFLCTTALLAQTSNTASWEKYTNNKLNITAQYPQTWRLDTTRQNAVFFIFTPSENSTDRFVENINLISRDISAYKVTLQQYVDINVAEVKKAITDFKQISGKYITWDGKKTYELVYTGKIESVDYRLMWKQWYTVSSGISYVLTYSSDGEKKDAYSGLSLQVMNAVKVK